MTDMTLSGATSYIFVYDCGSAQFLPANPGMDAIVSPRDHTLLTDMVTRLAASDVPAADYVDVCARNADGCFVNHKAGVICAEPGEKVIVTLTEYVPGAGEDATRDALTGLWNRSGFLTWIRNHCDLFRENPAGRYMVVYFDVQRFKAVNEMFGMKEGDRLLKHIADILTDAIGDDGAACHLDADKFAFFTRCIPDNRDAFLAGILDEIADFELPFEIVCNAGIYTICGDDSSVDSLLDRAVMAQAPIKGSYTTHFNDYTDTLRENLLTEYEITGMIKTGVEEEQFVIFYQPQYNHSTGMLVGAEALVRWLSPNKGVISPGLFISVFEKNGFIVKLDLYVFEKVCRFLRKCMDEGLPMVPISTNLTRYDIFSPNFIENLEGIRRKYDIPVKYLRIEITESVAFGNSQFINEAVHKLQDYGYVVEMDDFGSGYSSLNILKDIDFDIVKLDMKFLDGEDGARDKGGIVLSSMVRMMNWIGAPVIAEGVETVEQADFLKSIGCDYIQGYLYSKPLTEEQYEQHIRKTAIGATIPRMKLIDTLNAVNFWSAQSLETLIFSNFVGGAAIFEYRDGALEVLRVNEKYLSEFGMNLSEKDIIGGNPRDSFDEEDWEVYTDMLRRAIETEDEQECETWRMISSACCGQERMCIRSTVRMIGKSRDEYLFYAMVRNITAEKNYYDSLLDRERSFKIASEQVNIYYWEYTVATREMRPCFRCMRDLGLPPLLTDYPNSAIEMGVFPPETADMYRDWHRQIAQGAKELEAVIPLTQDRVPFRVRYTTEFDEAGRPVKAYGSAALIV